MILSCEGERPPKERPETDEQRADRLINIRCGHGKEKSRHGNIAVDYDLLLNPMQNNSSTLYYNDSGELEANTTNQPDIDRVAYTCNRLNLNSSRLKNLRVNKIVELEIQLLGLSLEEQRAVVSRLMDDTQTELPAFYSTIKDNFGFLLS